MCWLCFNNELPCSSSTVFWFLRPAQMVTKWIPINQHVQCQEFVFGWPNHSRNYWGTIFQSLLHLMHHSVLTNILFFPIFYLIAILHFLIVIIMRELKMRIWIYLLHFFFKFAGQKSFRMMNPCLWQSWYSCFFFSYIHILQLHWDGVHFQLNIPNLYGLKGYFHFF